MIGHDGLVTTDDRKSLLRSFPAERMECWAVGKAVGNVRNEGPELIVEVQPEGDAWTAQNTIKNTARTHTTAHTAIHSPDLSNKCGYIGNVLFCGQCVQIPVRMRTLVFLLLILSFINFMHACLILRQSTWYSMIDEAFARSLGTTAVPRKRTRVRGETHKIYSINHFGLAAALLGAAIILCVVKRSSLFA